MVTSSGPIFQTPGKANLSDLITALKGGQNAPSSVGGFDPTAAAGQVNQIAQQQQDLTQTLQQAANSRLQQQPIAGLGGGTPTSYEGGPGHVKNWIDEALNVLHMRQAFEPGIMNIIMHESSGNPNSVNRWDSNAAAGHPSEGLMQTIAPTFNEWALPGYNRNILDPVSNIIAGIRYARDRYGKGMLMAGGRRSSTGSYEGY